MTQTFLFNLMSSFHRITIDRDVITITAFYTPDQLFEWLVIPRGSSAAPGWSVTVTQKVIKSLECVGAYLDDIIVFDPDPTAHVAKIWALFEGLRKDDLELSLANVRLASTDADFLGHATSFGVFSLNSDKGKYAEVW